MSTIDHAVYSQEADCFVSEQLQRLAEILQDYDPALELRWIPPNARTDPKISRPYCIVHTGVRNARPYVVMYFTEQDRPEDILAKIFEGDNEQGNVLRKLEAQEAARKAFLHKEWLDRNAEAADKFHYLFTDRSPNYVNWVDDDGQKVKLDEQRFRRPKK